MDQGDGRVHCANCTALMEPGRKFLLILDNAPSHASRLACEHYKTVLHGTVEFQPRALQTSRPQTFFLWNELKVQLVQHPAPANPAELRALLTRVCHRTWAGSREMFEKIGNAWVRRLEGLRGRQRRFLRVAQTWQTASYRSKTQRKKHFIRHVI